MLFLYHTRICPYAGWQPPMCRLTCEVIINEVKHIPIHWEIFVLPNGIQFTTEPFDTHGVNYNYWFASESINIMDSVGIFYPEFDVRDTVKIYRIEIK